MISSAFRVAALAVAGSLAAALVGPANPAAASMHSSTQGPTTAAAGRVAAPAKGRTLTVQVEGLRPGMAATVKVKGPKRYKKSADVAARKTFKKLRPGKYSVRAMPVTFDGTTASAAISKSKVKVTKRRGATVTVTYTDPGPRGPGGDDQPPPPNDDIGFIEGRKPPVITTTSVPDATSKTDYSVTLQASGSANLMWSVESGFLPAGMFLYDDGTLSGTPLELGTFTFTVLAEDFDSALSDSQQLSLQVKPRTASGPQVITTSMPAATKGKPYSGPLASTGGTQPVTWAITAGSLPDGLYLSDGAVEGYPATAGNSSFTVQVTDDDERTASKQLSISVVEFAITGNLPPAYVDVPYSYTLGSVNGTAPVTFQLQSGNLPDGLNLDPSGLISGTPTSGASQTFTIRADDQGGATAQQQYTLKPVTSPTPVITTTSLPSAQQGVAYAATVATAGGTGLRTLSVSTGSLPAGLSINAAGLISGTPTASGTSNFTLTATDAANATGQKALSISVSPTADVSWPQNRRDLQQSAFSPNDNVITAQNLNGLKEVWSVPKASGTPAVRDGVLHSPGSLPDEPDQPGLIAYRLSTGDEMWRVTATCEFGDVAVTDVAVITTCNGKLRAYDRGGSHALLWDTVTTDAQASIYSFTVTSDQVIGNDGQWVYAYRLDTGARVWRVSVPPGTSSSSIAVSGSTAVVPMSNEVRAINTTNGSQLWTVSTQSAFTPLIVGNSVYVVTDSELTRRSLTTGAATWTTSTSGAIRGAMATDGTNIIALWETSDDYGVTNKLQAYKLSDGTLAWENSAPVRPRAVSISGGLMWISYADAFSYDGGVTVHRLSDGEMLRNLYTSGNRVFTRVVPAEGRVVLSMGTPQDRNLRVYGFGAPTPKITTAVLKAGTVGRAYSDVLTSTGGSQPTAWSLASGSLPAGLSLSSGGGITGTPTVGGSTTFDVRLTDAFGVTVVRSLTLQVNPGGGNQTWPTSGGSNTRRGLADKENLDSDNAPTWSQKWSSAVLPDNFPTGDSVVANGLVYYAVDDTVRGYSLTTGSTTDRAPTYTAVTDFTDVSQTTRARLQSAPTVDGNRLYVVASDGVYAFDATTGAKVWKASLSTYQSVPAPIVVGSRVIASDDTGVLRSFATSNGAPGWLLDLPGTYFWVGQMASDGTSLFGMQCTTAYAINATTGVLTWSRVMPGTEDYGGCFPFGVVTTPLVHDGLVYFGSYSTAALRTSDGTVAWSRKYASGGAMALSHGVLVLTELVPYAFGWSPQLRAVDPQSGALRWVNNTDFPAGSPAVTVVDDLVLTNGSPAALGLDIRTGERLWASDQVNGNFTAGTQVIPVGERVYFVGVDKRLHAYGGN